MTSKVAVAGAAFVLGASPAVAQTNLMTLDYFETGSTRTLQASQAQVQYGVTTPQATGGALANTMSLHVGLSSHWMAAGALQAGGVGASSMAVPSYMMGFQFSPDPAAPGWTTALQLQYQGGFNQAVQGRGLLSFDAPVPCLVGGRTERFNLSANLMAEAPFVGRQTPSVAYRLGLSYPLVSSPWSAAAGLSAPDQRWPETRLRATLEWLGDIAPGSSLYVLPGVFYQASRSIQLAAGLGLRLQGADRPVYVQTRFQVGF